MPQSDIEKTEEVEPPQSPQRRHSGDGRRQELIHAAYNLLAAKGFEGLRVRDVAERTGVNIATLHYYFPTKEALIRGVVEFLVLQFRKLAAVADAEPCSTVEAFRRNFADLEHRLKIVPEMYTVLMELELRSIRDPVVKALLKGMGNGWHTHTAASLRAGMSEGCVRADLDVDEAASMMIALIKGVAMQVISGQDEFDFRRVAALWESWLVRPTVAE